MSSPFCLCACKIVHPSVLNLYPSLVVNSTADHALPFNSYCN